MTAGKLSCFLSTFSPWNPSALAFNHAGRPPPASPTQADPDWQPVPVATLRCAHSTTAHPHSAPKDSVLISEKYQSTCVISSVLAPGKGKETKQKEKRTQNGATESPAGWRRRDSAECRFSSECSGSLRSFSGAADPDYSLCLVAAKITLVSGSPRTKPNLTPRRCLASQEARRRRTGASNTKCGLMCSRPPLQYEVAAFSGCKLSFCPTL